MALTFFHNSLRSLSDEELMQRVSENDDHKAFSELYSRHSKKVMRMLLLFGLIGQNKELATDLTQDTFFKVWSSRGDFNKDKIFRTWLYTIMYNLAKNEYRHAEYREEYEQYVIATSKEEEDNDLNIKLDNEKFDEVLRTELSKLSQDKLMLFTLRFEGEMTIPQIAGVMGIAEGTVKSRLHKLIQTLKTKLKQYE